MKDTLDFIVIGAQKAGTTSLFEYLRRHPELHLPAAKEVPYFSHDSSYCGDWAEYLGKAFAFADPGHRWGTVTPHYMVGGLYDAARSPSGQRAESNEQTVPSRIRERLPDVRLISILRDPLERARSHHAMAIMNGWDNRPFAQAISELLLPEALSQARRLPDERTGYVVWGEYGRILAGYLDVFPREQLLVLYTDELKSDAATVLRRVFEFLGVATDFVPDNLGINYRQGSTSRRLPWLDLNTIQRSASKSSLGPRLWHSIPYPARRWIDQQFDRANYLTDLWNRRADADKSTSDADTVGALREHYDADNALMRELLGVVPPWASSHAEGM
jgi:Sulfotransferase domain